MNFIGPLCLILITTTIAGHFANRIGIPAVIGELLVGIVLGPAMLDWIKLDNLVTAFSDIGVVILMFLGGLESDLKLLRKYLKPAIIVAVSGVILPVVVMGGVTYLFGFSFLEALFIGVVFSATSVSISVAVLKQYQALSTREGATILGAAVADDIIGVLLLSLMISLLASQGIHAGSSQPGILFILLEQLAFFCGTFLLVKWIAPYLMRLGERLIVPSSVTIMSMIICLSMAWLANLVGLSGAIGAFFAGIAVANTPYKHILADHVEPLGNSIFIPVFFVSVGLNMTLDHFLRNLVLVVVLVVLAALTKWIGCGLGAKLSGFDSLSSSVIGTGMIARGEMGLITAQIGHQAGLLNNTDYSAMILVIILVTLISPLLLKQTLKKSLAINK
ncbi:cation:proton antiporter [Companilactobacillus alimentarius]|uniref:Sodium:proton antiporter n=1 Tax=Companilactobacillus alimentarius DSM 20249 TaxID=1423720 RepID=A0A2K9HL20_9LACO|nr:cation:proton antiporter [Companilactobacillus alimentarius]AUI72636.1 sodium:proton antiporter [Companilactobacillus alimentarius DSM 20249]MDT6952200.1 cation:proton antiporter [Companilactobacillus alimentarius]GEO45646.1 sodium:proton antiporter [Companilactobacillus alimentarius]